LRVSPTRSIGFGPGPGASSAASQARSRSRCWRGFYVAIARGLAIPIPSSQLAVMVPLSFVVQMLPVSLNGFGVREAAFSVYFAQLGLPLESALLLSFVGAGLMMLSPSRRGDVPAAAVPIEFRATESVRQASTRAWRHR